MNTIHWNTYAHNYDALLYLKPYQQLQETVCKLISQSYPKSILDAGCGTGTLLYALRRDCPNANLYGIDASEEMLSRAAVLCKDAQIHFLHSDLNAVLQFKSNTFDAISIINTLYALQRPYFSLSELSRILRPGGTLVIATPKEGFSNGLILKEHCASTKPDSHWLNLHDTPEREELLLGEAVPDKIIAAKLRATAQQARSIQKSSSFHFFDATSLHKALERAGLRVIESSLSYARQALLITATTGEKL